MWGMGRIVRTGGSCSLGRKDVSVCLSFLWHAMRGVHGSESTKFWASFCRKPVAEIALSGIARRIFTGKRRWKSMQGGNFPNTEPGERQCSFMYYQMSQHVIGNL